MTLGWGVRTQVPAFRAAGWEIGALWVRNKEKIEQFQKDLQIEHVTDNYDQIIHNPQIDLVLFFFYLLSPLKNCIS
jgi:predicted dehydrogenase